MTDTWEENERPWVGFFQPLPKLRLHQASGEGLRRVVKRFGPANDGGIALGQAAVAGGRG
jgi:hydrogenase maturation factor HypF (carbamoyltransferase family)